MTSQLELPATPLHAGTATGPVLRLTEPLSLWGGTHADGTISDPHHPQHGERLTGRVVVVTTGRGSSSSSSVLAELIRSGHGPAALVLAEPDGILVLGALVAAELYDLHLPIVLVPPELHAALPDTGELRVTATADTGHLGVPQTSVTPRLRAAVDASPDVASTSIEVALTDEDQAILAGSRGPGAAFAMRLVVALARASGAPRLLSITQAHVDGCLYHGAASLDLALRLVELGAQVAVPTTSNVGSVDLLHPDLVRGSDEERAAGRALMEAYAQLGCRTTFTCAPYQDLARRPAQGEHVAWAESNAIAFVNGVVGARTARYGDFIDVAAAITGRAPAAGYHLDDARRARWVFDVGGIDPALLGEDAGWGLLGLEIGRRVGSGVPAIVGAPGDTTEDQLKAFGAGAASSGTVGMFHVVGVTPEAPTLTDAVAPDEPVQRVTLTAADLRATWQELAPADPPALDAVSLGTPHFSEAEFGALAELLRDGPGFAPNVTVYVSTSRGVLERARVAGTAQIAEAAGAVIVVDTCTYVTTILAPTVRHVVTNSAKWAWYGPPNLGVSVELLTMAGCVAAAREGAVTPAARDWVGRARR